jgi:putative membrane protein
MMGFGFVVARFGLFLREMAALQEVSPAAGRHGLSLTVGTVLIGLGVVVNVVAAAQHWRIVRCLQRNQPIRFHPLSLATIVSLLMGLLGVILVAYLLFGLDSPR